MSRFIVRPYIQLGDSSRLKAKESIVLVWHATDEDAPWKVKTRKPRTKEWRAVRGIEYERIDVLGSEPHRVYSAAVPGLSPGEEFEYLVSDGVDVFVASGRARKSVEQDLRFVVMGDLGQARPEQAKISYLVGKARPDFVFVPGDFVYYYGTVAEYRTNFYPFYTSEESNPKRGSSVMSSSIFLGGLGEHDWGSHDANNPTDPLGYFLYWRFPKNGPPTKAGAGSSRPSSFSSFPRMANYSFDYGDSHWTVLDSWNPHVDWCDPKLRRWLSDDLRSSSSTWKFVGCYLSPFLTSKSYPKIQKMRAVVDIFQDHKVDIVFSGYAHCYQRSMPLRFEAEKVKEAKHYNTLIGGGFELDREFDGVKKTRPRWPLYVVSSGGGASLHDTEQTDEPSSWQPFTVKYVSDRNSFTVVEIAGRRLVLRQVDSDGKTLDRITVTK